MPVSRNAHQSQFPATPLVRTMFVTRLGVSVLNVVATIDTPMSHHGADRPDVKNSAVLDPARRANTMAGMNDTTIDAATISQSSCVRRMVWSGGARDWIAPARQDQRLSSVFRSRSPSVPYAASGHRVVDGGPKVLGSDLQRENLERLQIDALRLRRDEAT